MCGGASESVSKLRIRSEGPTVARPGRQAGIKIEKQMSAKGAAPYELGTRIIPIFVPALCRAFGAHSSFILIPGLTAGAISLAALRASKSSRIAEAQVLRRLSRAVPHV